MTSISAAMAELVPAMSEPVPGAPEAELVLAPTTLEEMARVLDVASEHHLAVLVWGGGTHQGLGNRVEPDVVVSTFRLGRVVDYQPEDLTLVVEAGVPVALVEEMLAERRQTAVLPELPGAATVGGVVAAGVSGFRRSRYGPTRDRMLEATMVTGDGRIVRGGGRVVKNVTGYDLPRLITGSFGALGVVGQVCLKLWPLPEASLTVEVDDPEQAGEVLYRPLALLERDGKACAYLAGTRAEVEAQADRVGGRALPGLVWPEEPVGTVRWSLRVPPALTREAVGRVPSGWTYLAQLGVGEVACAAPTFQARETLELRSWAESHGGALVLLDGPAGVYELVGPWGAPPAALAVQQRLIDRFDPARVINPGRLPGGL